MLPTIHLGDYVSFIGYNDIYQIAVANIMHPPERLATNCFHYYIELNALLEFPKYFIPHLCMTYVRSKPTIFGDQVNKSIPSMISICLDYSIKISCRLLNGYKGFQLRPC